MHCSAVLAPSIASALALALVLALPAAASDAVVQTGYLKASVPTSFEGFGTDVAISGDTAVVGAWREDSSATGVDGDDTDDGAMNSGAAWVYVRSGGAWHLDAYLKASNTDPGDEFGSSVAISGDTIVIGAPQESSAAEGVDGDESDNSAGISGAAYVFQRASGVWSQTAYLKASNTGVSDDFGHAVAVSGNTIVVGAPDESSGSTGVNGEDDDDSVPVSGAVYVFVPSGTSWVQEAYLKASNTGQGDQFGASVALDGDTLVVGAFGENSDATGVDGDQSDDSLTYAGAAYVFVRELGNWSQQAYLKASNTGDSDYFGYTVDVDGETIAVGASHESSAANGIDGDQLDDSATSAGAAYVFERTGTAWNQQAYVKAFDSGAQDRFGWGLALTGDTLAVGAFLEDGADTGVGGDPADDGGVHSGALYVYRRSGSVWSESDYVKSSHSDSSDHFGWQVDADGDRVIAAAFGEDGSSSGGNGDPSDNGLGGSGCAFVFGLDEPAAPFCYGDGSVTPCPCANEGLYGVGCANSLNVGARLVADGTCVVADDDLVFTVIDGRPLQPSLLVQGASLISVPFKDGVLCMGGPTERIEAVMLDSNGYGATTTSIVTEGAISPGDTRYYQQWYRDPGGPCGEGSNFTQGLVVDWM